MQDLKKVLHNEKHVETSHQLGFLVPSLKLPAALLVPSH